MKMPHTQGSLRELSLARGGGFGEFFLGPESVFIFVHPSEYAIEPFFACGRVRRKRQAESRMRWRQFRAEGEGEGPCHLAAFEAAVRVGVKLHNGLPERLGIDFLIGAAPELGRRDINHAGSGDRESNSFLGKSSDVPLFLSGVRITTGHSTAP